MPTFHLVVDEVVPVARHRFRVRVWRRADSQPIVLLSQVQGNVPPDWCSIQLANLGFQTPRLSDTQVFRRSGTPVPQILHYTRAFTKPQVRSRTLWVSEIPAKPLTHRTDVKARTTVS
jgi:hypothetical protein